MNKSAPCRPDKKQSRRRRILQLVAILLACAAVRLWIIHHAEMISRDGVTYIRMAREMSSGLGIACRKFEYHPGYPAALRVMHSAMAAASSVFPAEPAAPVKGNTGAYGVSRLLAPFGDESNIDGWDLAGQIVSLLAAMAATAAIWLFAGLTMGWRIAWISAILFTCARNWAYIGADVLSDSLAAAMQLWAIVMILLTLSALRRGSTTAVLSAAVVGLFAGAGYLVRPEAILPSALALVPWTAELLRKRLSGRLYSGAVSAMLLTVLLCVLPYALTVGAFTKKKNTSDFAQASALSLPLAKVSAEGPNFSPPREFVNELTDAMQPILFGLATIWLVAMALRGLIRGPEYAEMVPLPAPPGAWIMGAMAGAMAAILMTLYAHVHYMSYRHLLPLAAVLSPLAGAGVVFIENVFRRILGRYVPWTIPVLFVLGMAAAVAGMFTQTLRPMHEGKGYYRAAGEALRNIAPADSWVLTDSNYILHYSGLVGAVFPAGTKSSQFPGMMRARGKAKEFLVVSRNDQLRRDNSNALDLGFAELRLVLDIPQKNVRRNPDTLLVFEYWPEETPAANP